MAEEVKLTSKELLNQLTAKHYQGALEAKAEGKPVVWATSICPDELSGADGCCVAAEKSRYFFYVYRHYSASFSRAEMPYFSAILYVKPSRLSAESTSVRLSARSV